MEAYWGRSGWSSQLLINIFSNPNVQKFRQSPTTPDSSRDSALRLGQNPGKVYLLHTFNVLSEASRYWLPDPTFSQIVRRMLSCRRNFSDLNACGSLYKRRFFLL